MSDRSTKLTRSTAAFALPPANRDESTHILTWEIWQIEIVALLQHDFGGESLGHIGLEDIDWPSWRVFFQQGKSLPKPTPHQHVIPLRPLALALFFTLAPPDFEP